MGDSKATTRKEAVQGGGSILFASQRFLNVAYYTALISMLAGKKGRLVTVTRDGPGEASTQLSRPLALALDSHNCEPAHLLVLSYTPGIRLSRCYASRASFGSFSYRI